MKRKILAVMLTGAMALQGGSWTAAAEEEILIVGESEGGSDSTEQDIPEMLEEEDIRRSLLQTECSNQMGRKQKRQR